MSMCGEFGLCKCVENLDCANATSSCTQLHVHMNKSISCIHARTHTHMMLCRMMLNVQDDVVQCGVTQGGEVGGWGRDPKKYMGRDWGMGSSTI